MNRYLKEYQWSNIGAMMKNNKSNPRECRTRCDGKLVVISGATSGIGYETARLYASMGADLLCINRNREKSELLCREIKRDFSVSCSYLTADYSRLSDIHAVARELADNGPEIDILIHNAGVYMTKRRLSEDGLEMVFQVNYLASFILNYILKDKLVKQDACRILLVNSEGHRFAISGFHPDDINWEKHRYTGLRGYGSAKTAQLLSLMPFREIFSESGVTINAMHPGNVRSMMGENNGRLYRLSKKILVLPSARSPGISAEALYYLGVSDEAAGTSGLFYNLTTEETPAPHALDREMAGRLWEISLNLGGLDN